MACKNGICTPSKSKNSPAARLNAAAQSSINPPALSGQLYNAMAPGAAFAQNQSVLGNLGQLNNFVRPPQYYEQQYKDILKDVKKNQNFWKGAPGQLLQTSPYSPQQQSILDALLAYSAGNLNQGYDFGPIEEEARANFHGKTIPSIAERFTAMGAQRSGGFARALSSAGSELDRSLAGLRSQYQIHQQGQLMQLLNMALQPRLQQSYQTGQPGFLHPIAGGVGKIIGKLANLIPGVNSVQ